MRAFLRKTSLFKIFKFQYKSCHQIVINSLPNPSSIVMKLRDLNHDNDQEWNDNETDIIENIHFFDADQFTDIVYLYGQNESGSHLLWELLSRKLFDYEFDQYQAEFLFLGFTQSRRAEHFVHTHLFRTFLKCQHNPSKKIKELKNLLNPL